MSVILVRSFCTTTFKSDCFFSGRCAVDVKYGDKPVPNSPFRMRCGPPYDASKVKVTGPAVEKAGPVAEEITKAVIDTTEAGVADLSGRFLNGSSLNSVLCCLHLMIVYII